MELVDIFNKSMDWLWSYDKTNVNADVELRDVGMTCMNSQMGSAPCPHHSWLSCIAIEALVIGLAMEPANSDNSRFLYG